MSAANRCIKFRTMIGDANKRRSDLMHLNERDCVLFKIANDPRITRMGHFLRKYSLDEIPRLLNVLSGDMSLVGPRPPLASEVGAYKLSHLRRLDVTPGITGLWQVEARRDLRSIVISRSMSPTSRTGACSWILRSSPGPWVWCWPELVASPGLRAPTL